MVEYKKKKVMSMIAFLKGNIALIELDYVLMEVHGVGYKVFFSSPEKVKLNEETQLFTYQHVREDELALYGFLTQEEHGLFLKLISVKGLGPKTAMGIFGKFSSAQIIQSIENKDVDFLKSLPGIGNKTASQIILDLKGKLVNVKDAKEIDDEILDALEGLKSLGYKVGELKKIEKYLKEKPGLSSDEYLKIGLQLLMKAKRGE